MKNYTHHAPMSSKPMAPGLAFEELHAPWSLSLEQVLQLQSELKRQLEKA